MTEVTQEGGAGRTSRFQRPLVGQCLWVSDVWGRRVCRDSHYGSKARPLEKTLRLVSIESRHGPQQSVHTAAPPQ
ncbi:unnamed protein product [Boreogadus saida]